MVRHGGDLGLALGDATGWLDLSTGINPVPYPVGDIPDEAWTRLPGAADARAARAAAARYLGVTDLDTVVLAPGSQALIQTLPIVMGPPRQVDLVVPTYGEHAPSWSRHAFSVRTVAKFAETDPAAITVLVNPNNPTGHCLSRATLERAIDARAEAGGFLVVDEAFCDVTPEASVADLAASRPVVVLRSFGKFFGLAGVRLGFATAPPAIAKRLRDQFGPWAVSGIALILAARAYGDRPWIEATRARLAADAARLDNLLADHRLAARGAVSLFRTLDTPHAHGLHTHLWRHRIAVRPFDEQPTRLRFGLAATDADLARLGQALATFDAAAPAGA